MFKLRKNKKGFTLVELMVVVVIIGILTAIAIPVYNSVTGNAKIKTALANQRTIDSAIQAYFADENDAELKELSQLVPKYIAVAPKDPYTNDASPYLLGTIGDDDSGISYVCAIGVANYEAKAILHNDAKPMENSGFN